MEKIEAGLPTHGTKWTVWLASSILVLGVCSSTCLCADSDQPAWPRFLGPIAPNLEAEALPVHWSPNRNVAWRARIEGYGQSSPVVFGERIFVTSISGPMKEHCHVSAYSLRDGKRLWKQSFPAASRARNSGYISKAAPTPVVDATMLVAWFEAGNLIGLSHDGEVRWKRDLVSEFGKIDTRHGLGSSLVPYDDNVIVWVERETDPYLMAVDRETGETRWKVAGLGARTWTTPCLLPVGPETHLVLSASGILVGFDPRTGKRLWTLDGLTGNTVPSPQPIGSGQLLVGADVGDGDAPAGQVAKSNGVVEVSKNANGTYQVRYRWRSERATSSFGSPVADGQYCYLVNRAGVLFCLDLATGKERYAKRIGDSVWATPLIVGSRIYFFGKRGKTVVVRTGSRFEKLAENTLWEGGAAAAGTRPSSGRVLYAVAVAGDRLLVRTGSELVCLSKQP